MGQGTQRPRGRVSGDTPFPGTRQDGTARATGLPELQAQHWDT